MCAIIIQQINSSALKACAQLVVLNMCAIIIQQINSSALKACAQLVVLNVCYNHTTDKQFCLEGLRSTGSAKPVCYNLYDK